MFKNFIKQLAFYLHLHNIISDPSVLTEENYSEYVKQFQSTKGLPITGQTDVHTLWELQYPFAAENKVYHIQTIDADITKDFDCLPNFSVRSDLFPNIQEAFNEVRQLGGKIYSSGALRSLDAHVTPGRSSTSLHYTGIAFDLCINAGFTNPDKDPYVVVRTRFDSEVDPWTPGSVYFKIFFRSEMGITQTLKAIYWQNHASGVDLYKEVTGKFICLSDVMFKHGFSTIPPRSEFLRDTNRNYLSSEWWHFNGSFNIVRGFSLFGIELIKTFGLQKVQSSPVWQSRLAVFNYAGFINTDYIDPKS
ncbi:MAG: hypothetical protein ACRCTQ_05560 [Brevinemataceae bacterium]